MALSWKRGDLDWIEARNVLLWGWRGPGPGCPEKLWLPAPSLAVFKARLDGAWSTLGWWKGSLPMAGGLKGSIRSLPTQIVLWFCITNILRLINRIATPREHKNQIKEVIRSLKSRQCIPPLCLKGNAVTRSLLKLQCPVHSHSLLLTHKLPSSLQSWLRGLSFMSLPFKTTTNFSVKNLWLLAQNKEEWLYLHFIQKAEVKTLLSFWKTEIGSSCTDRRSSISAITV